ncbi:hypothetical protein [Geminocystis sp. GBBB08]|uniref:hypothetical protein n=1 Tax=Geminocystis sp. GBBB08 TaxID=2604140 RepID=UPI0027E2589D|nr:hypothetical protein [Geminocystis sp. GBBB08]MBL1211407.1 hypothetical protein [Geminocystis sp. GBBB08]
MFSPINYGTNIDNFEDNKMTETVINNDFNPDNNRYKNDFISYNNQVNSVAIQEGDKGGVKIRHKF